MAMAMVTILLMKITTEYPKVILMSAHLLMAVQPTPKHEDAPILTKMDLLTLLTHSLQTRSNGQILMVMAGAITREFQVAMIVLMSMVNHTKTTVMVAPI